MANVGICIGCGETKTLKIKGACAACYQQFKRTGSYKRDRQPRGMCTVEGCGKVAHGKGMCGMHIRRLRVSGSLDDPRADNINLMTNQALYAQWSSYRRKGAYPIVREWYDSFPSFMEGVGNRPSPAHWLYRVDKDKPMGPGNFEWREKIVAVGNNDSDESYDTRYKRARKTRLGTGAWNSNLLFKYGITLDQYLEMFAKQNGVCAICSKPETALDKHGVVKALAVDHCHESTRVRELLCQSCNQMLGFSKDDPAILQAAIAYLAKHATPA